MTGERVSRRVYFKAGFLSLSNGLNLSFPQVVDKSEFNQNANPYYHHNIVIFKHGISLIFCKNIVSIIPQRSVIYSGN